MDNQNQPAKISRRNLLIFAGVSTIAASLAPQFLSPKSAISGDRKADETQSLTPEQALQKLMVGNQRYVKEKRIYPDQKANRRSEIAKEQHPFAVVLGCADSRVTPEIVFDQGLGDIFDIRVAGNILDNAILGSIEYAVAELGTPLVMILGHERCGAIKATLARKPVPGHISTLISAIEPAIAGIQGNSEAAVEQAVRANVKRGVSQLKASSDLVAQAVKAGKLKVVGARYDLDNGKVELLA